MGRAVYGVVFLLVAGCSGDDRAPDGVTSSSGDTAGQPPPQTTALADIVIELNEASPLRPANTRMLGVFTEPSTEISNLAQCLGGEQFCIRGPRPTTIDTSVDVEAFDPVMLKSIETVAAGDSLHLGSFSAAHLFDSASDLHMYSYGVSGVALPEAPLDLQVPGDRWPPQSFEQVVDLPDPVGLRFLDPQVRQDFVDTDGIPLRWLPGEPAEEGAAADEGAGAVGAPGEMFLLVETPNRKRLQRLADTGRYDLDLSGAGLADGDIVDLMLGRWTRGEVTRDGYATAITIQRNQRLSGVWRSIGVREPITLSDTCLEAQGTAGLDDGYYEGRFDPPTSDVDPGDLGCTGRAAAGADGILPIDVRPQHELTLRYQLPDAEASLYLLTDCADTSTCLEASDGLGPETIRWTNESGDLVRVYAVLDTVGAAAGEFRLDVRRRALGGDVLVNSCIEAIGQGPIGPGFFEGNLLDHANLLPSYPAGPCEGQRLGGEGIAAVILGGGATLDISTAGSVGDPGIHILSNCSIAASCVALGTDSLTYTNDSAFERTVYIVLDAELGIDQYRLNVTF